MTLDSPTIKRAVIYSIIYVLLTGYLYSFSRYGLNIWDEGGFAYGTLRTLQGQSALEDFNPNGYPPGRYIYAVWFFKLFGVSFQSLRIAVLVLTPAMVLGVYSLARRVMPPVFAGFAGLMMLSAPSMYHNRFFTFFLVANLYLLVLFMTRGGLPVLALLTGSILLTFFFKIEVALFSLTVTLFLFAIKGYLKFKSSRASNENSTALAQSKGFRAFALVAVGVGLALLAYFMKHDMVTKIIQLVWETHQYWGNPFPTLWPFFENLVEWGPHEMFERFMFYPPLLVYAWTAGVLVFRCLRPRAGQAAENWVLAAVLLFGMCAYGLVLWRAGFDNLLRTLPPFYILLCYWLWRTSRALASFLEDLTDHPKIVSAGVATVLLIVPALYAYEMNVHHGFYAGTVGALRHETTPLKLDRVDVYTNATEADWIKRVVATIQKKTAPGEPIFALPLNPIFYFLADRPNPTPYDWILPGMLDDSGQREVVAQLEANPPKLILYVDIAIDGKEERRLMNYAPIIFEYIVENYRYDNTIGFFQLLLPKD